MEQTRLTPAMEDYLKAVFYLEEDGQAASTAGLASHLQVAAPSVSSMIKRLHDLGMVDHSPYREIQLTPAGRALAIEVIRHHRLIELYLAEFLDVPWEQVHDEAERLEHVLSEDLESRMAAKLGYPGFDPHGHPIPTDEGTFPAAATLALWDVSVGQAAIVARVSDRDPGLLHYLADISMTPGASVEVVAVSPYAGTQTVRVSNRDHVLGRDLTQAVQVRPVAVAEESVPA